MSASRLKIEVFGLDRAAQAPGREEVVRLCEAAAATAGVSDGHLAIELVSAAQITELNQRHRNKSGPTDVLSFPIDGLEVQDGVERELGDVVICPEHTVDLREAIVHGVLHLLGMDHEADDGQMLATQARVLACHSGAAHSGDALSESVGDGNRGHSTIEGAEAAGTVGGNA